MCRPQLLCKALFVLDIRSVTCYDGNMAPNRRSVLRKQGFKLEPLIPISLRLPAELWQKCGWAAESVGLNRTEFVRNALNHATKNAQPPEDAKSRMILASNEEWSAWQEAAKRHGAPVSEVMRRLMNRLAERSRQQSE